MQTLSFAKSLVMTVAVLVATVLPHDASAITVPQVISALQTAYDAYKQFEGGDLTNEEAIGQMLSAIDASKQEILDRIDNIAAAGGSACAKSKIADFENFEQDSEPIQKHFASEAFACLSLLESLLGTVEDPVAVDKLGLALNALGPITMMARAHAFPHKSREVVENMVINGNWAVIAKLHPQCSVMTLWGDSDGGFVERNIRCTAYNGDRGFGFSWVGDPNFIQEKTRAEDRATRNTSRAIAQQLNPVLLN